MRLIDADALVSALNNGRLKEQTGRAVPFNAGVAFALTMVEYAPTIEPKRGEWIDAVPVVRCKDCKHFADDYVDTGFGPIPAFSCDVCELYGVGLSLNHYCSCGERKDDD